MIIQGVTLSNINVYDASFNSNGALLYLDSGQAASYPGSGTTWTDLSGNSNNATLVNSPAYTTAWNGNFSFSGTGAQYASTTASKFNTTYTGKTVFVAARITAGAFSAGTFRCLFGTNGGTRNFNTYIYSPSSGVYQIHYSAGGGGGFSNNLSLTTNQWFTLAVTHTTGGLVSYYLNGQPVGTNTGITFIQYAANSGEYIALGDNYWYGDLPVCAVYSRALNASEILQNHNSLAPRVGLGIVTTDLLANYDTAGYSSGSTVADTSGNGRSLTLYNTPTATTANRSPVIAYNGSTQWAIDTTGYGTLLNTSAGFTYDVWARPNAIANGTLISEWSISAASSGWNDAHMALVAGKINSGLYNGAANPYITGPGYSANTWYHIVMTYNGATNILTLYVNGVSQGTVVNTKANPTPGTFLAWAKPDIASGSYVGGATGYFAGQTGAWKVYSSALSADQVNQNFNALRSRYGL
jgi:hypothetical protein